MSHRSDSWAPAPPPLAFLPFEILLDAVQPGHLVLRVPLRKTLKTPMSMVSRDTSYTKMFFQSSCQVHMQWLPQMAQR